MLEIGYFLRGEIIWNKASSASPSTAWGSWLSAGNPVLRDIHEYILVFSKKSFSRKRDHKKDTIRKEEFLEWTKSVWTFPAVSARSIGHPAPFPEELPHRLIQLYTFKGDVVLDPFCGSGTACLAALKDGRHYIGYDSKSEYVKLAGQRIEAYLSKNFKKEVLNSIAYPKTEDRARLKIPTLFESLAKYKKTKSKKKRTIKKTFKRSVRVSR